jgi:hypothetical protein
LELQPNVARAETPMMPSKRMPASIITSMMPAENKLRRPPPSSTNPCYIGANLHNYLQQAIHLPHFSCLFDFIVLGSAEEIMHYKLCIMNYSSYLLLLVESRLHSGMERKNSSFLFAIPLIYATFAL